MCKSCQNPISPTYFFCPYCGKKLKQPPLSTSVGKQIGVYFLAVFFPFLTVVTGFRYINQSDSKSKAIGIVTLLLTGLSILLNVYFLFVFMDEFKQLLNSPLNPSLLIDTGAIDKGLMDSLKGLK